MNEKNEKQESRNDRLDKQAPKKAEMSKIDTIKASKMPEWQKQELIKQLENKSENLQGKVPFSVYARVKNLGSTMQKAMLAYPSAKKVSLATIEEWNAIFKNF